MPPDSRTDFVAIPEVEDGAGRCVTCETPLRGRYCHVCGERIVTREDMRVRTFAADALHGAFDLDSRLWRSVRALLFTPGQLTAEHMRGRRRPYVGPFQLFLLANLLFFALLTTVGGFSTFTTRLHDHLDQSGYRGLATEMVERRAPADTSAGEEVDTSAREEYERRFDETTPRYANSMLILLVPMQAGVLFLLYGGRKFFVHHLVFSLHFYAWLLLVLTGVWLAMRLLLIVLLRLIDLETVQIIFVTLDSDETILGFVFLSMFIWYLVRALQRAYSDHIATAFLRVLAIIVLLMPIVTVYRFILFLTVYYRLG